MSKLEMIKSRAAATVERNRQKVKLTVHAGEVMLGAGMSGYVSEMKPDIAGIPTDAGAALLLIGAGIGMAEPHLLAFGLGFGAGYMRDIGRAAAQGGLSNVLPFAVGA